MGRVLYDSQARLQNLSMHIDENELERATSIIDEIFGNDPEKPEKTNRLGNIIWDKRNPKGDAQGISYQHEFIVVAAKSRTKSLAKHHLLRLRVCS